MNRTHLRESSWPAQTDEPIWETTVGELLREQFLAGGLEAE